MFGSRPVTRTIGISRSLLFSCPVDSSPRHQQDCEYLIICKRVHNVCSNPAEQKAIFVYFTAGRRRCVNLFTFVR